MSLTIASEPTTGSSEIRSLTQRPNQRRLIEGDPNVRRMLGSFVSALFVSDPRGFPEVSSFVLMQDDGYDEGADDQESGLERLRDNIGESDDHLLVGTHSFKDGSETATRHSLHVVHTDDVYEEPEVLDDEGNEYADYKPNDMEDSYYLLESNNEAARSVQLTDPDDLKALGQLIEANYQDDQSSQAN